MIPTLITVSGILATIIYIASYLTGHAFIATTAAIWTMCSDFLDGNVARILRQETELGAALDPINDRFFLMAVLGNILYLKGVEAVYNVWGATIIASEIGIILVVVITLTVFNKKVKVNFVGKIRQIGHLILMGTVLADSYYAIGRFAPLPQLRSVLQMMAFLSFTAFVFYLGRAFTICQKNPLIK
ncbi:MAG: CDP-alcohol phosphatidyltransferase family protein [Candidatus Azambacteria bacterium]|nr:CDP-alcohol phosphatidyltransferase family protein [Candidatus Azambacteria bacterium]